MQKSPNGQEGWNRESPVESISDRGISACVDRVGPKSRNAERLREGWVALHVGRAGCCKAVHAGGAQE